MSYASFSTTSLFEYLPTRYQATCEQQMNRREVYDFKDGYCSDRVYNGLKDKILSIVNRNSRGWVVNDGAALTNKKIVNNPFNENDNGCIVDSKYNDGAMRLK